MPKARVHNLVEYLDRIDSTVQYSWLLEIARTFHGFPHDRITPGNIGELLDRANHEHDGAAWDQQVWKKSGLEAVFLTNEFDDSLEGWDTEAYVPCLRTDDLVLKLHEPRTIARLRASTGVDVQDRHSLKTAIGRLFERFVGRGARACAISLPPDFAPRRVVARPRCDARSARRSTGSSSARMKSRRCARPFSGCWPSFAPSFGCRLIS